MKLRFLGAAGTVTGSRTLLTSGTTRILIDCGLFQGFKFLRQRNWERLEVDPRLLDAVVLSHAHLDHSGFLPALVKQGFSGPVYCTRSTGELLQILLPDYARIQEEDAAYANEMGFSKHKPALPLYTRAQAVGALARIKGVDWDDEVRIGPFHVTFSRAGHILGAASIRVASPAASVLFSGDLGGAGDLVLSDPAPPPESDHLVMESTYGDRLHDRSELSDQLAAIVSRTVERGGVVVIPSFAVGRTQAVLWSLHRLRTEGRIPDVPVFLDSPMALDTTELYLRHVEELRVSSAEVKALHEGVVVVRSAEESRELNTRPGPYVVVSSSGMLTGGRVLHHVAHKGSNPANTLLFAGYQAAGSRGARLLEGEESLRIHGVEVPIRCEIAQLGGFSAHADQGELIDWMRQMPSPPRRVFLNHGEPAAMDALRRRISRDLNWSASAATEGVEWDLGSPVRSPGTAPIRLGTDVNPAYTRADRDLDFLGRDDMRSVRLMLEYLKVEKSLVEHGIAGTIAVFGSARIGTGPCPEGMSEAEWNQPYEEARTFGAIVGRAGSLKGETVAIMTGGGGGIMEAANRGAFDVGASTIGLNITLPWEQQPNPYITRELCFQFRYFAIRKMHFLRRAKALVAFPGGFGTFDELYDALCLIQVGKMPRIPVVLVGQEFWDQANLTTNLVRRGLVSPEDADLVTIVNTADEAWGSIVRFYDNGNGNGDRP